jgi:rhamnosyltransferase
MQVSVAILTRNAGSRLAPLLDSVRNQALSSTPEVLVVDSGSSDATLEIAGRSGAVIHSIEPDSFNHGATRNLAVNLSAGDLIAFLSQDALPVDDLWLASLVAEFANPRVVGAYSRVIPQPDATPLVERSTRNDLVHSDSRHLQQIDDVDAWGRATPWAQRIACHFNNVASCVRRSAVLQRPFPELSFGEDLAWGKVVMEDGGALVYEPRSAVIHSHSSGLWRDFRRHRDDARLHRNLLGHRPKRASIARSYSGEVLRDLGWLRSRPLGEKLRYGGYSPWLRGAQALGRAVGSSS